MTRGKMLGGSSGANYMFSVRGNKNDYKRWVNLGNKGWEWETVLRYFKKFERMNDKHIMKSVSADLHNTTGYLGITRPLWIKRTKKYIPAFKEAGHRIFVATVYYR